MVCSTHQPDVAKATRLKYRENYCPLVFKGYRLRLNLDKIGKNMDELATEEWVKNRWGGFTYLVIGQNEDFVLDVTDGDLFLRCETDVEVNKLLIAKSVTRQTIMEAEALFGCR
jgi:hypothetical protein